MPLPCPGCDAPIDGPPVGLWLRCRSCGAVVRCRAVETSGPAPVFEVYVAGRKETLRRVEVPWDAAQQHRLSRWLLWSCVLTLGLVLVLYVLARLLG